MDELTGCEDLDLELLRVDREQVVVAGDEHHRLMCGCERHEVVIVGVAADGRVRASGIAEQGGLAGEVGDEAERFARVEVFAEAGSSENAGDLAQQSW